MDLKKTLQNLCGSLVLVWKQKDDKDEKNMHYKMGFKKLFDLSFQSRLQLSNVWAPCNLWTLICSTQSVDLISLAGFRRISDTPSE